MNNQDTIQENPERVAIFSQRVQGNAPIRPVAYVAQVSKEEAERISKETTERELAKLYEQMQTQKNKFVAPQLSESDEENEESSSSDEQAIYVPKVKRRKHSDKESSGALKYLVQKQESIIRMNSKNTKLKMANQALETRLHLTQLDLSSAQADLQKEKKGTAILIKKLATAHLENTDHRGKIAFLSTFILVHLMIQCVYACGFTNERVAHKLGIPLLWVFFANFGFLVFSGFAVLFGFTT